MKIGYALVTIFTWLLALSSYGHAEPRNALVIGVSHGGDSKVDRDADHMAIALSGVGFDVLHENDVSVARMDQLLAAFSDRLNKGGVGLFYYAGHGAQVDGHNFLMPQASSVTSLHQLKEKWIDLEKVINVLSKANLAVRLVFLDACRDNPFLTTLASLNPSGHSYIPGLAKPEATTTNTLISFATAPGAIAYDGNGRDDWYTVALLKFMPQAGLRTDQIIRNVGYYVDIASNGAQIPWTASSLRNEFYFRAPVYIQATLLSIDDALVLTINGEEVLAADGPIGPKKIPLQVGLNQMVVRVYNQHTFTGGIEGFGGHLPEGWNYTLRLQDLAGRDLTPLLSGGEDRPVKDGPHHGHLFTVASGGIVVDEGSGQISIRNFDRDVWQH